jgi:hypothetical protein
MYRSTLSWFATLVGGECSVSRPGRFTPGERVPGNHCVGGWVNLTAVLDDVERRKFLILPGLELRPLGRPARSRSLYQLSYPGSHIIKYRGHFILPQDYYDLKQKYADKRRSSEEICSFGLQRVTDPRLCESVQLSYGNCTDKTTAIQSAVWFLCPVLLGTTLKQIQ